MHNLKTVYARMEWILNTKVPDNIRINIDKDDEPGHAVRDVISIEEEWIVDPKLRKQLSLIDLDEDV